MKLQLGKAYRMKGSGLYVRFAGLHCAIGIRHETDVHHFVELVFEQIAEEGRILRRPFQYVYSLKVDKKKIDKIVRSILFDSLEPASDRPSPLSPTGSP